MDEKDLKQIGALFKHHIGILSEDFQHKLDLVIEGQQMLNEKVEATRVDLSNEIQKVDHRLTLVEARLGKRITEVETRLDNKIAAVESLLAVKIDSVAADLSAHRKDTEAHQGVYLVKESCE